MLCNIYDNFEFSAPWITLEGASDIPNCALQFYKEFDYIRGQNAPVINITAESYYVLFVNGHFIGRGPVRGTASRHYFDAYDLSECLHNGKNHLGILVQSMNQRQNFNSSPSGIALRAEMPGITGTDTSWRVQALPGWGNTTRNFSFQHGYKVQYDFRQSEGDGWLYGEGTDNWAHASLFSSQLLDNKELKPRAIPDLHPQIYPGRLMKCAEVDVMPLSADRDIAEILNLETWHECSCAQAAAGKIMLSQGKAQALIYDFGTPRIGFFETTVTGEYLEGVRLDITYGEELWNGRVRAKYPNPTYFFTDTYFLHSGINRITHPFEMHGATLVQLVFRHENSHGACMKLTPMICRECRYPYGPDADFHCSDPLLEEIWTVCSNTMRACTTDTFMDCPWREHAFWVNDLVIQNRASMALFGPSDIHRRAFDLAFSQQTPDGWIPAVAPTNASDGAPTNILPATNLFIFWMLQDYLMSSGDSDTVRCYLPNLQKVISAFEATRAPGDALVTPPSFGWNFYSWEFELNWHTFNNCRESMLNSLYICALKTFMNLCQMLNYPCNCQWCTQRIEEIGNTLRRDLYIGQDGVMEDPCLHVDAETDAKSPIHIRSELSQALAMLSGIWTAQETRGFIDAICHHALVEPELYLSGLLFQALSEYGGERGCMEALQRIRKHWGEIVRRGCSTLPESALYGFGREAFAESGSLCHAFGTSPAVFFQKTILGIQPLKPGYREFSVNPQPLDLTCASGKIFTTDGPIEISWSKQEGRMRLAADIPQGLTGILPDGRKITGKTCLEI